MKDFIVRTAIIFATCVPFGLINTIMEAWKYEH